MQQIDGGPVAAPDLQALAFTGLGHFTTMLVENGRVRGLPLHLARLVTDARTLFDAALDEGVLRERIRAAIADEPAAVVVRVTIFDPALTLTNPGADAHPRILVSPRPAPTGAPAPMRVRSVPFGRQAPEIKHTGLFGALHQRRIAQRAGFDDALFVDDDGILSEGPTWNIGFVSGDEVVWAGGDALPGVTRALLAEVAGGRTEPVRVNELARMDAAFATSSGAGIRPIASIDDRAWPTDHPTFARLRTAYAAIPGNPL
ncbi:aminotransferase class IV family protein [Microbacterium karelineae]|uniref:aminotransferase class IV family protein n=1 Tax=Microbacterium karelineae TaxID=2654283 RepID=UPI0012EAF833|nr:aminotransferase class IV family protein [Microbacterium karelineae]